MKRVLALWFALAVLGPACTSGGGGGPAPLPFDPFAAEPAPVSGAAEPASGGNEAPGTSAGSIPELCAQACARLGEACGVEINGTTCASSCATSGGPGCAAELSRFVSCLASSPVSCTGGRFTAPACDALGEAFSLCRDAATTGGV